MKHTAQRSAIAAAILGLLNFPAAAAETMGDTIVVTATRTPSRVSTVLSDITVLDRDAIEHSPADTLPNLLATLPGISLTQNGGPGATTSLFIRGTNSNHALVLIDGQRVSSATQGTTAIEHLPLEQIERIEILRGPASSLYGADAIGGVIQIFTRRASGPVSPYFAAGVGRYRTKTGSLGVGGETGETRFNVLAGWDDGKGFSSARAPTGSFTDVFNPDIDSYSNHNLSARVARRLGGGTEIGAQLFLAHTNKQIDTTNCDDFFTACTANFDNRQQQDLESYSAYLSATPAANWKTVLRVGRSADRNTTTRLDPVAQLAIADRFDTSQGQATWQNDVTTSFGTVMAALEWRQEQVDSTKQFVVSKRTSRAAVLGYQGRFGDHDVQASGRVDDISLFGSHRSGSLAYGYRFLPGWRVHASIARAFHAPTFNDLYWPLDQINLFQGNPNLKPERARNREIGLKYDGAHSAASLTVYHNEVRDLINFVPSFVAPFIGQNENLASTTLQGATASYTLYTGPWTLQAHADILSARDDASGRFLQRRVPRSAAIEARRPFGALDLGIQVTGTSRRFNDTNNTQTLRGYGLVNVHASYRLVGDWSVQARLGNLFDKNYVLVRDSFSGNDFSVPGRNLFVGVRYAPK